MPALQAFTPPLSLQPCIRHTTNPTHLHRTTPKPAPARTQLSPPRLRRLRAPLLSPPPLPPNFPDGPPSSPRVTSLASSATFPADPSRRKLLTVALSALPLVPLCTPRRTAAEPPAAPSAPFRRLRPGLMVQDLAPGRPSAPVASAGATVSLRYVLRRANGYLIYSSPLNASLTEDTAFVFRMGAGEVIEGFEEAVDGLAPGGQRRFVVSPELGYQKGGTAKDSPGPIPPDWGARRSLKAHAGEPLLFEVLVESVRGGSSAGGSRGGGSERSTD